MRDSAVRIMTRVIRRRMAAEGRSADEILAGYPKLSDSEKDQIRERLAS